jgi:membrane-associated PAP2 superfamily phosphatase
MQHFGGDFALISSRHPAESPGKCLPKYNAVTIKRSLAMQRLPKSATAKAWIIRLNSDLIAMDAILNDTRL